MSLHERYLPNFTFREVHRITIAAPPEKVYHQVRHFEFKDLLVVRILFFLRGIPSRMMSLQGLDREKFRLLEEQLNHELIIGLIGQFWKPDGNLQQFEPAAFVTFQDDNFLKATWNFRLEPANGNTILETETRIYCPDERTRKKFRRYWFVVRPFSGWIRMEMLKAIRRKSLA